MTYTEDRDIHDLTLGIRPRVWPTAVSEFLIRKVGEAQAKLLSGPRPIGSTRRQNILDRFARLQFHRMMHT